MKDLLFHFGITLGKRYTNKQKQLFINELTKEVEKNKWEINTIKKKKFSFVNTHIIIGNLKVAETVLLAAYDTPTKSFIPNLKYYPFKQEKNLSFDQLNLIIQSVISGLLFVVFYFVIKNSMIWDSMILKGIVWIISLFVFVQLFNIMTGYPNRFNYNRNSAALALIIDLLKENTLKKKVAFILVDKASSGLEGFKDINDLKIIPQHVKTIILDGLASGEYLAMASSPNFKNIAEDLISSLDLKEEILLRLFTDDTNKNQVFNYFPNGMMLVSGDRDKNDLVLHKTRTSKDFEIELERLIELRNAFVKALGAVK